MFASAVAGILPLAVGGFAIVGTLLVLRVLAQVTDVSIYALNLTTALGLGLAIDYSLFIVSRYREELRAGRDPGDALIVTMRTAGRTVLFSAATVAVSLLALLVFPLYCAPSATPASPWSPWPRSAPWSSSRPCWPCSAAGSTVSACPSAVARPLPSNPGLPLRYMSPGPRPGPGSGTGSPPG